jgi:hypothetical protein
LFQEGVGAVGQGEKRREENGDGRRKQSGAQGRSPPADRFGSWIPVGTWGPSVRGPKIRLKAAMIAAVHMAARFLECGDSSPLWNLSEYLRIRSRRSACLSRILSQSKGTRPPRKRDQSHWPAAILSFPPCHCEERCDVATRKRSAAATERSDIGHPSSPPSLCELRRDGAPSDGPGRSAAEAGRFDKLKAPSLSRGSIATPESLRLISRSLSQATKSWRGASRGARWTSFLGLAMTRKSGSDPGWAANRASAIPSRRNPEPDVRSPAFRRRLGGFDVATGLVASGPVTNPRSRITNLHSPVTAPRAPRVPGSTRGHNRPT